MRITKKMIDEMAALDAQISELAGRKALIEKELKARGDGIYCGFKTEITVATSSTSTLDQKLVKGILTPAQIAECTKTGTRTRVVIRELPRVA